MIIIYKKKINTLNDHPNQICIYQIEINLSKIQYVRVVSYCIVLEEINSIFVRICLFRLYLTRIWLVFCFIKCHIVWRLVDFTHLIVISNYISDSDIHNGYFTTFFTILSKMTQTFVSAVSFHSIFHLFCQITLIVYIVILLLYCLYCIIYAAQ